ncbi:MAG: hypothetical protein ACE5IP_09305 [Terriglobia bacterium]
MNDSEYRTWFFTPRVKERITLRQQVLLAEIDVGVAEIRYGLALIKDAKRQLGMLRSLRDLRTPLLTRITLRMVEYACGLMKLMLKIPV